MSVFLGTAALYNYWLQKPKQTSTKLYIRSFSNRLKWLMSKIELNNKPVAVIYHHLIRDPLIVHVYTRENNQHIWLFVHKERPGSFFRLDHSKIVYIFERHWSLWEILCFSQAKLFYCNQILGHVANQNCSNYWFTNGKFPSGIQFFNSTNKKNGLKATELKCLTKQTRSICINIIRLTNTHLTIVEVSFITIKVAKFSCWHVW